MEFKMKRDYKITVVSETELEQMERIRDLLDGRIERIDSEEIKRKF
tara:strand:+ start:458 stop:595 length:138 start_codon:yes stop_codon:yes gene_type:complete